jgi:hypothetical protein
MILNRADNSCWLTAEFGTQIIEAHPRYGKSTPIEDTCRNDGMLAICVFCLRDGADSGNEQAKKKNSR